MLEVATKFPGNCPVNVWLCLELKKIINSTGPVNQDANYSFYGRSSCKFTDSYEE